jgi:hypothetical protein
MFQMQHGSLATGSHAISGTGQNRQRKMIEQILNRRNIMRAYSQVLSNGSGLMSSDSFFFKVNCFVK